MTAAAIATIATVETAKTTEPVLAALVGVKPRPRDRDLWRPGIVRR
jgi:hypothetical protein